MILKNIATFIAICISLTALSFAIRNYRRKSGIHVRGQFCISSSAYAEDKYVSSITLENFKDRSVIIFKIFLRISPNYYIELDDFEREPKILKSYESFTNNYGPVDFYCHSLNRIKLNNILTARKSKINIILSTSNGKYVVKEWINRWDPIGDFFKNHLTVNIQTMRPTKNNGYYGYDFKYLVKMKTEDGYNQTIPIYSGDINRQKFKNFRLTDESLSSKDNLENFLIEQVINGKLKCLDVEVIDAEQIRISDYGFNAHDTYDAERISWLSYLFFGKSLTIYSNIRLFFINRKQRKHNKLLRRNE